VLLLWVFKNILKTLMPLLNLEISSLQTLYAPVQGNARAKKGEWVGRGLGGGMGDLWDSIENVNEENT
jgi:cell division protein FtsW (lipid II flippase)